VLDADALGHLALAPDGAAYAEVLETFGPGILEADGRTIDRRELGRLVFDDAEQRSRLEAVVSRAASRVPCAGHRLPAAPLVRGCARAHDGETGWREPTGRGAAPPHPQREEPL